MVIAINMAIFLLGCVVGLVISCVALISGTSRGISIYIRHGDDDYERIRCVSARIKKGSLHTEFPDHNISLDGIDEMIVEGE